jgi:hypothetical protein
MEQVNQIRNSALELESMLSTTDARQQIENFAQQNSVSYQFARLLTKAMYEQSMDTTITNLSSMQEAFGEEHRADKILKLEKHYFAFPNGHKTYFLNQEFRDHIEMESGRSIPHITAAHVQEFMQKWQFICKTAQDKQERIVIIDPAYTIGYKFVTRN